MNNDAFSVVSCSSLENVTGNAKMSQIRHGAPDATSKRRGKYRRSWPVYQRIKRRREKVFRMLMAVPPVPRVEIARRLGVSRMTVWRDSRRLRRRLDRAQLLRMLREGEALKARVMAMPEPERFVWLLRRMPWGTPVKGRPRGKPFSKVYQPRWNKRGRVPVHDESSALVAGGAVEEGPGSQPRPDQRTVEGSRGPGGDGNPSPGPRPPGSGAPAPHDPGCSECRLYGRSCTGPTPRDLDADGRCLHVQRWRRRV